MLNVLDHADIVYGVDLSRAMHYINEHAGRTDPPDDQNQAQGSASPDYWAPVEDWLID